MLSSENVTGEACLTQNTVAGSSIAAERVAERAFDLHAEARGPALRGLRPRAILPGRPVTHVLRMAAGELRDPVAVLILTEPGDPDERHQFMLALPPP